MIKSTYIFILDDDRYIRTFDTVATSVKEALETIASKQADDTESFISYVDNCIDELLRVDLTTGEVTYLCWEQEIEAW